MAARVVDNSSSWQKTKRPLKFLLCKTLIFYSPVSTLNKIVFLGDCFGLLSQLSDITDISDIFPIVWAY
jgi:hypothetical protein